MFKALPLIIFSVASLSSFSQNRFDIVFNELMVDPAPQVSLPNAEWIELKNTSASPVNLQNWRIMDETTQSGPFPNFFLQPDSFVIICSATGGVQLASYGTIITVTSMPSLDNDGELIFLRSASGKTIHAIKYSINWYHNELKKEGGWSLEMIDQKNPCAGLSNWKASIDPLGGTPGKKNSITGITSDNEGPGLVNSYMLDSISVILEFNEPLDSLTAVTLLNYSFEGLVITQATMVSPLFNEVKLLLQQPLLKGQFYYFDIKNLKDCKGNRSEPITRKKIAIPLVPSPGELVINEILFNPRPAGYDYVEFLNNSTKTIDASKLYIANLNSSGAMSSIKLISSKPQYIFPGEYLVITENAFNLSLQYLVKSFENILEPGILPSFPDDKGNIILLDAQGVILDQVNYKDDWHFKLIDNAEGISLEKIDPSLDSNTPANWHSAATSAGYGTPGYKNSQYKLVEPINTKIEISPKIFSPDNDGRDDVVAIQYSVDRSGFVSNVFIYDVKGRIMRHLVKNGIMGINGYWNWDGMDEDGNKLYSGPYVIYIEMFNLEGNLQRYKRVVVLINK